MLLTSNYFQRLEIDAYALPTQKTFLIYSSFCERFRLPLPHTQRRPTLTKKTTGIRSEKETFQFTSKKCVFSRLG